MRLIKKVRNVHEYMNDEKLIERDEYVTTLYFCGIPVFVIKQVSRSQDDWFTQDYSIYGIPVYNKIGKVTLHHI